MVAWYFVLMLNNGMVAIPMLTEKDCKAAMQQAPTLSYKMCIPTGVNKW